MTPEVSVRLKNRVEGKKKPRMGKRKHNRWILASIMAGYVLLTSAYAILVPPWETPDEPAHYRYTAYLANHWQPAPESPIKQVTSFSRDYAYISSNYEWFQPALGYLPGAILYKAVDLVAPDSLPEDIPPLNPGYNQPDVRSPNLFILPSRQLRQIWQDQWGLLVIRMGSGLIGALVVWATYKIGTLLDDRSDLLGLIAAGWVALLPQYTFVSGSIRGDTLGNAFGALLLLACAVIQRKEVLRRKDTLVLGALLGLGVLTKHTFLFLLPLPFMAILLRQGTKPKDWLRPWVEIILTTSALVALYLLAFVEARTAMSHTFGSELQNLPQAFTWEYLKSIPYPLFIGIFFARFGWANLGPAEIWSRLAFGIWSVGFLISCGYLLYLMIRKETRQAKNNMLILLAGILLAILGVLRYNLTHYQPQGRLLFPSLAAWGVVAFWGWRKVLSNRLSTAIGVLAVLFMLFFNLNALIGAILPAYH